MEIIGARGGAVADLRSALGGRGGFRWCGWFPERMTEFLWAPHDRETEPQVTYSHPPILARKDPTVAKPHRKKSSGGRKSSPGIKPRAKRASTSRGSPLSPLVSPVASIRSSGHGSAGAAPPPPPPPPGVRHRLPLGSRILVPVSNAILPGFR